MLASSLKLDGNVRRLMDGIPVIIITYSISHETAHLWSLTPKLYSFQITFSICMPTTHHIFISVRALTPKLNPSALAAIISRLVTLTMPTH